MILEHLSYGDCLEVKREYYQNCSVLDCVTQCSLSTAHLYEQFYHIWAVPSIIGTGPTDWICYIGTLMPCIEVVALSCITVIWWNGFGGIQAWSLRPTGFHCPRNDFQCVEWDRSNRLGLSHWHPYSMLKGGCLELYYFNMMEWFWWDSSLILTTNCFQWSPKWPVMCWVGH